jgi:hypothetical protein
MLVEFVSILPAMAEEARILALDEPEAEDKVLIINEIQVAIELGLEFILWH